MSLFAFLKSRTAFWLSFTGTTTGLAFFVKDLMQGGQFTKETNETGKVFIVTGANTGIGKETVRDIAKRGGTVYMACRNLKKCEEAREEIVLETKNKYVYCRQCDLASQESIRHFVAAFKREQEHLHVLINNAGVMRCPRSLTSDGIELQLGVNHMGHFLLTNLLLGLLKKSSPSRIVNVSSLAHTRGEINTGDLNSDKSYDEGKAYSQSKLANVLFTRELAKRLEGTNVTANALHPGVVDTEIIRHMGFFNNFFAGLFVKPLFWPFVKTPRNGAQTSLYVALDPELEKVTGQYFSDCKLKEMAPAATDTQTAKWLWAVSEKWTKPTMITIQYLQIFHLF
ncbi:retinol dehydrogenase 12 isoform X1 [Drosophila mauritiana]|uniref:NADP-retinol dehydrogenase n=2 Tax=Drosophila mauritiana TaxID=7226 RepID=A0A6P8JB39_DROMA|nr:retinol dehydrogenase 12 isoform X1 [Drosophila mauritiana]